VAGYAGRQGRKPLPTQLKVVRGNPGRRPLNDREPQVAPSLPKPPKELSASAKRLWKRVGEQLLTAGIVTELDGLALSALVQSYARWLEAQTMLAATGLLIRGADGQPALNPLLRLSKDAQAEYTRMLSEFGLTPSSRSRIVSSAPKKDDPFGDFLKGKKDG
jgi:P27 family predicted phage terminase small subunit